VSVLVAAAIETRDAELASRIEVATDAVLRIRFSQSRKREPMKNPERARDRKLEAKCYRAGRTVMAPPH
jgi:hypothetical protein